ncbi:MAG: hypothetical protein VE99_C0006G0001, partial [candidate division Kazan bacterium GW2011_GWC1_52_13]
TDEGDGEQRYQRAGLQQHGAADAEHQPLERGRGTAGEQLLERAAGQLTQSLLEALHAEQEQRQPRAEFEPAAAGPERPGQQQYAREGQEDLEEGRFQDGFARIDELGRRSLLQRHRDRKAQRLPVAVRMMPVNSVRCSRWWCSPGSVRRLPCPARPPAPCPPHRHCRPAR